MNNKGSSLTPAQALEKLDALYEQSVNALRSAISEYIETGKLPDQKARTEGLFVYPSLSVTWDGSASIIPKPAPTRALPTPAATAPPSPALRCSARILKNNSRCCTRITARTLPLSPRSMRSRIRT
jgi:hypothetical protein